MNTDDNRTDATTHENRAWKDEKLSSRFATIVKCSSGDKDRNHGGWEAKDHMDGGFPRALIESFARSGDWLGGRHLTMGMMTMMMVRGDSSLSQNRLSLPRLVLNWRDEARSSTKLCTKTNRKNSSSSLLVLKRSTVGGFSWEWGGLYCPCCWMEVWSMKRLHCWSGSFVRAGKSLLIDVRIECELWNCNIKIEKLLIIQHWKIRSL